MLWIKRCQRALLLFQAMGFEMKNSQSSLLSSTAATNSMTMSGCSEIMGYPYPNDGNYEGMHTIMYIYIHIYRGEH
jgi:hypothetical protein